MRAKQLLTIAVVSTLLLGGMAALGAAAPADGAADSATDAHEEKAPDDAGNETNGAETDRADDSEEPKDARDRAGGTDTVGPSDGLPEQVPDHVSGIHDRIGSFLDGSIDDLGGSLSELNADGGATDEDGETDHDDDGDLP